MQYQRIRTAAQSFFWKLRQWVDHLAALSVALLAWLAVGLLALTLCNPDFDPLAPAPVPTKVPAKIVRR